MVSFLVLSLGLIAVFYVIFMIFIWPLVKNVRYPHTQTYASVGHVKQDKGSKNTRADEAQLKRFFGDRK